MNQGKTNLPRNAHPRTCRCALHIASSWSSQTWSLQTRMGRRPRCHSKPLRETRVTVSLPRGSARPAPSPVFRWEDLIPQLEKPCVPSKSQPSTREPQTARPETSRQPEKFISWSCEKKNLQRKRKRKAKGAFLLLWISQLQPCV